MTGRLRVTEIAHRVEAIRAGSATMLTWDQVEARIDARADRIR